jgi:hypothetical protein
MLLYFKNDQITVIINYTVKNAFFEQYIGLVYYIELIAPSFKVLLLRFIILGILVLSI